MTSARPPTGGHSAVDVAEFVARLRATAADSDCEATKDTVPILVGSPLEEEPDEFTDAHQKFRLANLQQLRASIVHIDPVLRWKLAPPAARGLVLTLVALLFCGGWLAWRSLPRAVGTTITVAPVSATPDLSASAAPIAQLVVQVVGPVTHPGIVHLPEGSRVVDAIRAAGGMRKGVSPGVVNLARRLVDGEQLSVGPLAATPASAGSGSGAAPAPAPVGLVDLNTATLAELDTLPRVGPVMAQRIIDWRTSHGRFASVDELREIAGIGSLTFASLSRLVRV